MANPNGPIDLGRLGDYARPKHTAISFADYVRKVEASPRLARGAHARMYDAIVAKGVEGTGDNRVFGFFRNDIFGIDDTVRQIVDYFGAAARGMDIRRRVLLLLGPVGSAKSTIVHLMKRGYEAYARTDEGAMYGIVGCPHHEEPLHALPDELREALGVRVEGYLCPYCQTILDEELDGDVTRLAVERVYPDENRRVAIGTFAPQDPLSQTMDELVGSLDLSKMASYGSESDARAYRFDGACNVASRGILELIEILKTKQELLYALLTLAQERQLKAGRFELFHVDTVIIGHTNLAEFERFAADRKNEAIQNRIFVIRVPYNLELAAEMKIYQYMLKGASLGAHVAPGALKAAARWTLLSRYAAPEGQDAKFAPMIRLRLYNRDFKGEYTPANLRELRTLYPNDGMEGISPRQTLNALSMSVARKSVPCVNPIDLLSSLKGTISSHVGEEVTRHRDVLEANIAKARELYDAESEEEVERAFIYGFDDIAQHLFHAYLENAAASLNQEKIVDPVTGEDMDPDLNLLQSIEQEIDVRGEAAREFRREILARVGDLTRRGETFDWQSHARFKEAVQKRLFKDVAQIVKITTSARVPDPEQRKKIDLVTQGLVENGYCEHCAAAILQYVGQRLNR